MKFQDEKEVYIKIRDVIKNKLLNISLIGKYKSYDSSENYVQNKLNQIEENKTEVQNINVAKNIEYKVKENNEYENKDQEAIKINEREDLSTFKSFKEALEEKNHIDKSKEDLHDNISYGESLNNNNYDRIHEEEQSDYYSNMGYIENNTKESKYNDIDKKLEEISTQESFLEEQDDILDKIVDNSQNTHFRASDFKVIGTILNTYIVLEKGTSMYLLDQHAAHEKVLY